MEHSKRHFVLFEVAILSYFQKKKKTGSSKTMKTATTVCVIQCRIETNVADRPCRILWQFMLAVVLDIIHRATLKDTGELKSFL